MYEIFRRWRLNQSPLREKEKQKSQTQKSQDQNDTAGQTQSRENQSQDSKQGNEQQTTGTVSQWMTPSLDGAGEERPEDRYSIQVISKQITEASDKMNDALRLSMPDYEWRHNQNDKMTFNPAELIDTSERSIANHFGLIMNKVAEDLTGLPRPGETEWDIQAIAERKVTRRPLAQCQQTRDRERVVLLLDNSGSCQHQAEFYAKIARAAIARDDVEVYYTPNAWIQVKLLPDGNQKAIYRDDPTYSNDTRAHWRHRFQRRTILFFGDCDGIDEIEWGARYNKVYWLNCAEQIWGTPKTNAHYNSILTERVSLMPLRSYACRDSRDFIHIARRIR